MSTQPNFERREFSAYQAQRCALPQAAEPAAPPGPALTPEEMRAFPLRELIQLIQSHPGGLSIQLEGGPPILFPVLLLRRLPWNTRPIRGHWDAEVERLDITFKRPNLVTPEIEPPPLKVVWICSDRRAAPHNNFTLRQRAGIRLSLVSTPRAIVGKCQNADLVVYSAADQRAAEIAGVIRHRMPARVMQGGDDVNDLINGYAEVNGHIQGLLAAVDGLPSGPLNGNLENRLELLLDGVLSQGRSPLRQLALIGELNQIWKKLCVLHSPLAALFENGEQMLALPVSQFTEDEDKLLRRIRHLPPEALSLLCAADGAHMRQTPYDSFDVLCLRFLVPRLLVDLKNRIEVLQACPVEQRREAEISMVRNHTSALLMTLVSLYDYGAFRGKLPRVKNRNPVPLQPLSSKDLKRFHIRRSDVGLRFRQTGNLYLSVIKSAYELFPQLFPDNNPLHQEFGNAQQLRYEMRLIMRENQMNQIPFTLWELYTGSKRPEVEAYRLQMGKRSQFKKDTRKYVAHDREIWRLLVGWLTGRPADTNDLIAGRPPSHALRQANAALKGFEKQLALERDRARRPAAQAPAARAFHVITSARGWLRRVPPPLRPSDGLLTFVNQGEFHIDELGRLALERRSWARVIRPVLQPLQDYVAQLNSER